MCVYGFFPQRGLEINEFDSAFASICIDVGYFGLIFALLARCVMLCTYSAAPPTPVLKLPYWSIGFQSSLAMVPNGA